MNSEGQKGQATDVPTVTVVKDELDLLLSVEDDWHETPEYKASAKDVAGLCTSELILEGAKL